jgi:hypothetical protein
VTPQEAVKLCRLTQACCPAQKFDAYTPDAWMDLLSDIRFEDAAAAVKEVARKQPFVSPSEIRAEVRRVRSKRIAEDVIHELHPPADLDPDDARAYISWLSEAIRALGDGEVPEKPRNLVQGNVRQLAASIERIAEAKSADVPDADTEEAS